MDSLFAFILIKIQGLAIQVDSQLVLGVLESPTNFV